MPMDLPEYTKEQDVYYDFCLWEYKPVASTIKKFRSVNLLYNSFDAAGAHEQMYKLVQVIRKEIGISKTVWGTKLTTDGLRWEFYFYDYKRRKRTRSITSLLHIIKPFTGCEIEMNENLEYFMFSIDITGDLISGARKLDEIHMYIGNPGSSISSGICYSLKKSGTCLENFYFFFDAQKQSEDILNKVYCSAHLDTRIDIHKLLWPELRNCKIIVVANKKENDAVYFSGITIEQLIFFLKKMKYPEKLVRFAEENRTSLDHMLYDAGYDYQMEGDEPAVLKSGYYGIF
jgi:hypothetical protein